MPRPVVAALLLVLLTPATLAARSPVRVLARQGVGVGTSYGIGRMERVIAIRRQQGYAMRTDLPHISLPDCGMIGRVVRVRARQTARQPWSAWTQAQAADCSAPHDWGLHTLWGARVWGEISYPLAQRWGVSGRFIIELRW